jgi:hypothetical protein
MLILEMAIYYGSGVIIYVPIGLSYYGSKGFNFGIDVGPRNKTLVIKMELYSYAGLKLGENDFN